MSAKTTAERAGAGSRTARWAKAKPSFWVGLLGVLFGVNEIHNQRRRLRELTGHQLRDIGLTRAEAEGEVRKPFWRR